MEAAPTTSGTADSSGLDSIITFGNDETERAYYRETSGCSNLTHFLSSPACQNAPKIRLSKSGFFDSNGYDNHLGAFSVEGVRAREERREEGSFLRFLRALPTSACPSLKIEEVELLKDEEVSALCQAIASPLCTLRQLLLENWVDPSSTVQNNLIAEALLHNTSLQELAISADLCSEQSFAPALISRSSSASPLKSLHIFVHGSIDMAADNASHAVLSGLFTGLANNTISLHELTVSSDLTAGINAHVQRKLGEMLRTNSSLTSLSLWRLQQLSGEEVLRLFTSLEKNLNLTSLSLHDCKGENWPSISTILDCLRINGTITELNLEKTPLHGQNDAAIEAQLEKNWAHVEHMKVLKSRGTASVQVQPTTICLFLCGLPYSGKTTLSRSLANWDKHTHSSLTNLLSHATLHSPQRTQGIEVNNLEKDGVKISLWDLAGQREFYSFHDYMLPSLNNIEGRPSMFLFVWNPIQVDQSTGRELKDQLKKNNIDRFRDEFNYWLMFIACKTLKSIKFRPKVLVAITRADKKKQTGFTKSWIQDIILQCQEEFKDYLYLDIDGVFDVDARYPHKVQQLALHVFNVASSLLKSVPPVYKACDDARNLLTEMVDMKPLMRKDDFFRLCQRRMGIDNEEMKEAIAHSLNNSGDLIYLNKSALLVVVDVKWFCHHIMGSLLSFGMNSENKPHEHGVFPFKCLEELLEEEATSKYSARHGKHRKSIRLAFKGIRKYKFLATQRKIRGEELVKVLIELGLACQLDGEPGIFILASLSTGQHRSQIQPSEYLKGDRKCIKTYMGRRLRCKNTVCTFFAPGFFPALQVTFHHTYNIQHGGLQVTLKEDVIAFARGGVEVLMEFCQPEGEKQFIDILIQSHLDLDTTIEWMREEILQKVEKVCAGPRGLQGVELAHEVIQPACVEKFMCLDERKTRAISLEELRASLKGSIEKKGSLIKFEDCLNNAYHTWQIDKNVDLLISLLGNEETWRIVESFRLNLIMDVDDALGINIERETICFEKEPEKAVFSSTLAGKERELIFNEVKNVNKNVQEIRKDIQKILNKMDYMCNVVLSKLQQRMEELLKFSKEGEAERLPRFFVVTRGEGKLRRIVAAMVPAGLKNVRLELLCEHGPHLVVGQIGLEFEALEDGWLKSGLSYIITVLKVVRVAMRVGAHVFVGLGNVVSDFTSVLALIEDTSKGLPSYTEPDAPFKDSQSRTNFQEGQQWLRNILSKHKCPTERIHEVFGLTCVRYLDLRIG